MRRPGSAWKEALILKEQKAAQFESTGNIGGLAFVKGPAEFPEAGVSVQERSRASDPQPPEVKGHDLEEGQTSPAGLGGVCGLRQTCGCETSLSQPWSWGGQSRRGCVGFLSSDFAGWIDCELIGLLWRRERGVSWAFSLGGSGRGTGSAIACGPQSTCGAEPGLPLEQTGWGLPRDLPEAPASRRLLGRNESGETANIF